ncbi:MAG TPA: hypothetical protein VGO69_11835, partial [Pyrinomonadaceae bacterium]|nr:hypothetical protein [Pyrinomonadaceae bacterium]
FELVRRENGFTLQPFQDPPVTVISPDLERDLLTRTLRLVDDAALKHRASIHPRERQILQDEGAFPDINPNLGVRSVDCGSECAALHVGIIAALRQGVPHSGRCTGKQC